MVHWTTVFDVLSGAAYPCPQENEQLIGGGGGEGLALQSCSEMLWVYDTFLCKECPDSIPGIHLFICKTYGTFFGIEPPYWLQESGAALSFLDFGQRAFLWDFGLKRVASCLPTQLNASMALMAKHSEISLLFLQLSFQLVQCSLDSFEARSSSLRQWSAMTYDTKKTCHILLLYDMEQMGRIPAVSCSFASLWIVKIKILHFWVWSGLQGPFGRAVADQQCGLGAYHVCRMRLLQIGVDFMKLRKQCEICISFITFLECVLQAFGHVGSSEKSIIAK